MSEEQCEETFPTEGQEGVESLRQRYAAAQIAIAHANSQYASTREEADSLRRSLTLLQEKYQRQEEQLAELTEQNSLLAEELSVVQSELAELHEGLANGTLSTENAETMDLRRTISEQQNEIDGLRRSHREKDQQLNSVISSTSFRIGRSITGIARMLPGMKKAG